MNTQAHLSGLKIMRSCIDLLYRSQNYQDRKPQSKFWVILLKQSLLWLHCLMALGLLTTQDGKTDCSQCTNINQQNQHPILRASYQGITATWGLKFHPHPDHLLKQSYNCVKLPHFSPSLILWSKQATPPKFLPQATISLRKVSWGLGGL